MNKPLLPVPFNQSPNPEELSQKARERGVNLSLLIGEASKDEMEYIAGLLSQGVLNPYASAVYPISQMADAHSRLETNRRKNSC